MAIKYNLSFLSKEGWKLERYIYMNNHSTVALLLVFFPFVSYTRSLLAKYRGSAAHLP